MPDALSDLGELTQSPEANIIKLPNISASVPQLKAAIEELQGQGYGIPDYPDEPGDDGEREIRARYDRVKGSAVNPVLRQGNSDRRAPASVKDYARRHPQPMGEWSSDSRSHVTTMSGDDFRSTERSHTVQREGAFRIEHVDSDGKVTVLKGSDTAAGGRDHRCRGHAPRRTRGVPGRAARGRQASGVLFSVQLKTTMMRVADPIIFGHVVRTYFKDLFEEHGKDLKSAGVNPNDGLGALLKAIESLPDDRRAAVQSAIDAAYRAARRSRWSTPSAASRICTCPAT